MDLTTKYLNLDLRSPVIVSACRLSESIDNIKQMEKTGAGAVVMYSIFEEEIRNDDNFNEYFTQLGADSFAEALTYFPKLDNRKSFLQLHLSHLTKAVKSVSIPVIGSLNCVSNQGWLEYAIEMQNTGISALELNLYHLPLQPSNSSAIEKEYINIVSELKKKITIPLAIKIAPFYTSLPDFVYKLDKEAGVDGVVLFNRFYSPDLDIKNYRLITDIELSVPYEGRLPRRWIALLNGKLNCSILGSTGVSSSDDLIKYILVGADAVACASCLMRNGIDYISNLIEGLKAWMQEKNYSSLAEMRGLINMQSVANKNEFERAQYTMALRSFKS